MSWGKKFSKSGIFVPKKVCFQAWVRVISYPSLLLHASLNRNIKHSHLLLGRLANSWHCFYFVICFFNLCILYSVAKFTHLNFVQVWLLLTYRGILTYFLSASISLFQPWISSYLMFITPMVFAFWTMIRQQQLQWYMERLNDSKLGVLQDCTYLFTIYAKYIMKNAATEEIEIESCQKKHQQ